MCFVTRTRLVQRLADSGFARSVGILASGTLLAQAIGLITTPIVSRLYTPADFGDFALIGAGAALLSSLISLGMRSAIVKAPSEADSRRVLAVTIAIPALIATVVLVATLAMSPMVRFFDSGLDYIAVCMLVWSIAVLDNATGALSAYANRGGFNRVLFMNSLLGAAATLIVTVSLGLAGVGALGLVAGTLCALLVSSVQMVVRLRPFRHRLVRTDVSKVFRANRAFITFQYPANIIENLSAQAPRLALSPLFGSTAIGLYAMTDKLLGVPLRLVGAPVGTVYFREASKRSLAGEDLAHFTLRVVVAIMALAYLPLVVTVIWGEPILAWLLGPEWAGAGALASILIVRQLFILLRTSVGMAWVVLDRQPVNLAISVLRLIIEVGALVAGALTTGNVIGAFMWFAAAGTLFYLVELTLMFRALGRLHWQYLAGSIAYVASIAAIWLAGNAL